MAIQKCFQDLKTLAGGTVVRQLGMDKVQAIKHLEQAGYSERRIAEQLGISRKAVRNHLGRNGSKDTKAPTGSALTGSEQPKDTKALTGSGDQTADGSIPKSASHCAQYHELILVKLEQGLDAARIYQDLRNDHPRSGNTNTAKEYGYLSGEIQSSSGYVRVRVGQEETRVDYVRTYLPAAESQLKGNGDVSYSYIVDDDSDSR